MEHQPPKRVRKLMSDAEWEVMEGVWHFDKPVTVREVRDYLYPNGEKAYTTVQTIMNILVDKGILKREKRGPVNLYTSLLSPDEARKRETRNLVSRLFRGSFGALANYLVDSGDLSKQDLDELKSLIEKRVKQQ